MDRRPDPGLRRLDQRLGHAWSSALSAGSSSIAPPFGRRVQAIGSNRQAALFSGIRISRTRIMVMTLMGFIVGIAAVVALAFNRNGSPTVGVGTELGVIAATIIGGTALSGGSGSVLGAILGALIIALIQNGLALLAVPPAWSTAVTGIVIIVAVTLDYLIKRRCIAVRQARPSSR